MKHSPRYYQKESVDALMEYFSSEDAGHPLIELPTAAGKSLVQALIVQRVLSDYPDCRLLFLTHQAELIKQNFEELKLNLPEVDAGIYSAGLNCRDTENKVLFAGIQSVYKKALELGRFNLIIVDECFTGDTKILTPYGEKRIDKLCCNDVVYNAIGEGLIKSISKRKVNKLYIMELSNGEIIKCTGSHPFFTSKGWIQARHLERGQNIYSRKKMCEMWENFLSVDKNKKWKNKILFSRKDVGKSKMLLSILLKEIEEPYALFKIKRKDERIIKKNRTQTLNKRWKWLFNNTSNNAIINAFFRLDCRISNTNESKTFRKIISHLLQNRCRESSFKNRYRNRWSNSLWGTIKKRFKKEEFSGDVRVENISYKECGCDEFVYNIQVSNHPSYYASGVLVHNCHLISRKSEGMYLSFLKDMFEIAPYCKIVGLTATPYRLDSGLLTEGDEKIFDEIIYRASLSKLIKEGYLCELIGKAGIIKPDVSKLHKRGGEYIEKELNEACDNSEIIQKAVKEIVELTEDRKHILIFCTGILHAEHVAEEFKKYDLNCEVVHSKKTDSEKERILTGFRNGDIRIVANVDMLTTGFNAPHIDCICLLRPTMSTGLYYQMCGRGLRLHPDKKNCLILDYGGNILQHGPLDKIEVQTKGYSANKGVQTAPMKECPACMQPVYLSCILCPHCGHEWPVTISHESEASSGEPISKYQPPLEYELEPYNISFNVHEKNGNLSMRVDYHVGVMERISEWVCIEHDGYAEKKARQWLKEHLPSGYPIPDTVEECLNLSTVFKKPELIFVDFNQKFPRIVSRVFPKEEEKEIEEIEQIENFKKRSFIR